MNPIVRKFSVDPNLTSYDILKSILMRAFDLLDDESEFVIYFSSPDADWMPLLSDWDLDVAILSSADPVLSLRVTERKIKVRLQNVLFLISIKESKRERERGVGGGNFEPTQEL